MKATSNSMKAYETGRRAIVKGEFSTAQTAFRWASSLDPRNPIYTYAAATAAFRAGNSGEAERLFERAIEDTRESLGVAHPHYATVTHGLVELYEAQDRQDEARRLSAHLVDRIDPAIAAMSNTRALGRIARLYRTAGRTLEAAALYRLALAHRRAIHGDNHPKVAECLAGLAEIHHHAGKTAKAKALLKLALDMTQSAEGGDSSPMQGELREIGRSIQAVA